MKTRTVTFIAIYILMLILFASCAKSDTPPTAAERLSIGEKYLLELNYEQAVVQFLNVIEIEPKNARAYLGAAEAYIALGEPNKAIDILQKGLEATSNPNIESKLKQILVSNSENVDFDEFDIGSDDETPTYYQILTIEQKELLSKLESALRDYYYTTADYIQRSEEYRSIVDNIPGDNKHERYNPDNSSTMHIFREGAEPYSYHADLYIGSDGEGLFIGSNYSSEYYSLHVVEYAGGRANGTFADYIINYDVSGTRFLTNIGEARDGRAFGKVMQTFDGETYEIDAESFDWWPNWDGQ
jgi:tetratricopeptide (TPR) repeat protein